VAALADYSENMLIEKEGSIFYVSCAYPFLNEKFFFLEVPSLSP
jgi:hypothetical protein